MGNVRQDNVQIKLEIDGSQSKTELDNLTRKAQVLTIGLKEMKRGTDEYIAASKELRQVNSRIEELRKEIGLAGLSINQMGKLSSQLNRELKDLVPGTEGFVNKSKELREVDDRLAKVRAEVRGVKEDLDKSGGGFLDFVKKSATFAGVQLGVEAVVGSIINLGKESVAEFAQAQGAAAQLEASLNSTGYAAGLTKQELLDLSSALEGKTILDGDAITQAQSVLLTFTKIKKGVYEEALPAIVDMATKLGGDGEADLKGATIQVGKALNDPVKGITALAKAGVSFSEDQKAMIKSLVETGDVAAAQTIILSELKTEFGGSAEAAAKAGTGPLKQFQVQIGSVKEGLGELIIDGLQAIQPVLLSALKLFAFLIEALRATPAFIEENRGLLLGLAVALLTLNAGNIAAAASALALTAIEKGRAIATTASATATRLLGLAMSANPVGLFIAAIALLIGGMVTLYEKSEKVREVIAGLSATARSVFTSIKDIVVNQLGSVATLLAGIFTFNPALIKKGLDELGPVLSKAGSDAAGAYHAGYSAQEAKEQAAAAAREKVRSAEKLRQVQVEAEKTAVADREAQLGVLKRREADIEVGLSKAKEGGTRELALRKQLIGVKADIEAIGEKKTADDVRVIRAHAQAEQSKLDAEFAKKQHDAAEKAGKEQQDVEKKLGELRAAQASSDTDRKIAKLTADAAAEKAIAKGTAEQIAEQRKLIETRLAREIAAERQKEVDAVAAIDAEIEKRRTALIKNEYERRVAELRAAAAAESVKVKGTDAQVAEQRRLIQEKLQQDLLKLEKDRMDRQTEIDRRIIDSDQDIAVRRAKIQRDETAEISFERVEADAIEHAARLTQLNNAQEEELANESLTANERLAIIRQFNFEREQLDDEYAQSARQRNRDTASAALGLASQVVQTVADFQKIGSDKELARLEKDKKARLLKLDQEYKAGTISKAQYEQQKSNIESNYDAKTRAIKKQAAEKEKEYNIAQAVIATALAVIKAAPNPYLMVAAGVAGALSVAKIIATPIPEFAKGGVVGAPMPTWRDKVRQFASGGINKTAGVPSVGQLHSGGGIRMVDGATGQHLGEWERGEPYMILSRETYANNKPLIDDLLDTSLYRGGAPVRSRGGHYADGGTPGGSTTAGGGASVASSDELLQVAKETRDAIKALPSRQRITWEDDDTAYLEARLDERQEVRNSSGVR